MGGSKSKAFIRSLSEQVNDIAMSTVQSCEVMAQQDQTSTINNSGFWFWGNIRLEQKSDIDAKCFSDSSKEVDMQNKIINALKQTAEASGTAVASAIGGSNSETIANLENKIRNNLTMSNIQKSYSNIKQNQSLQYSNSGVVVFQQIDLTQGSKLFAAATLQEMDKAGIFNDIAATIDQKSIAKTENPLEFLTRMVSAFGQNMIIAAVILVLVVGAVAMYGTNNLRNVLTFEL